MSPTYERVTRECQETISNWAEETFGPVTTNVRTATRLNDEMAELLSKLAKDDTHPGAGDEMADVLIILFRLAEKLGYDLLYEVDRKMEVNRGRTWILDGTGHGHHA